MRKKALSNEERKIQVINWFGIRIQHDNHEYASLYEIARGLGMSPSSHLRKIVNDMVSDGFLESQPLNRNGRWDGRGYMLKRGTFKRNPPERRTVTVKSSKGITQMEMF